MNTLMKKIKVALTKNARKNVLEIEFYPSWNILEFHFFIAVRTLNEDFGTMGHAIKSNVL